MRKIFCILITAIILQPVAAQTGSRQITLDDLYKDYTFKVKDVPGFNAMKDGRHFTKLDEDGGHQYIRIYNLENGAQGKTLFDNVAQGISTKIDGYEFSKDERKMLLLCESENIYRNSVLHRVYVYDVASGKATLLDIDKVLHAGFSPDGSKEDTIYKV